MINIVNQNNNQIGTVDSIGTVTDGILQIQQVAGPTPDPGAFTSFSLPYWQLVAYPNAAVPDSGTSYVAIWCSVDNIVAAVDIYDNDVWQPPYTPVANAVHTGVFRQGGQPIQGSNKIAMIEWKVFPAGVHNIKFVAYDDNGGIIDTVTKPLTVNALPAGS